MLHIADVGLSRRDALEAVKILRRANLPILGGDVYFLRGDKLNVAIPNNWFTQPDPSEDSASYFRRSWEKAETYIENFPEPADAEVLFSLVVKK